jgi:hypothetical protein
VWKALSDVTAWPAWLPTVTRVEALSGRTLSVGAKFKVEQPKRRPAIWTVSDLIPGRSFAWQSATPGLTLWANRTVTADATGESKLMLEFRFSGLLAPLVALFARRITQRYLAAEAASLKALAEGAQRQVGRSGHPPVALR